MPESVEKLEPVSEWSHDIRTHLHILLGAVDMMDSGKLSQEQWSQYTAIIRHNAQAMLRLVNRALEQKEPGAAKLTYQQIDGLLVSLAKNMQAYAANRQLEMLYDVEAPLCAYCDAEMIERVLNNLLSNAVKYTQPKGFVYLSARKSGGWVQINVSDTGCGLPIAQMEELQDDGARPACPGTGLRIVRELIAAMGGRIECTSRLDIGTTFYLKIPARRSEAAAPAEKSGESARLKPSCAAALS